MGFRYVPDDLIRHSDFYRMFLALPPEARERARSLAGRFVREHPDWKLSPLTGPGYFLMHWLMGDLYASLAVYLARREAGEPSEAVLAEFDAALTEAGTRANRFFRGFMRLPGAFRAMRAAAPRAMALANGRGFRVVPGSFGRDAFGFTVRECPYARLYADWGCPEIGPVVCRFDETVSTGIRGLEFVRKGTLCRGDGECDFLYRKV